MAEDAPSNDIHLHEEVEKLTYINRQWKKDFDRLKEENRRLRMLLQKADQKDESFERNSKERDVVYLQSQVEVFKEKFFMERGRNKELEKECERLKKKLEKPVKTLHTLSKAHNETRPKNSVDAQKNQRLNFSSKQNAEEKQKRIMALHSVPGIHIPGTFYAWDVVKDTCGKEEHDEEKSPNNDETRELEY